MGVEAETDGGVSLPRWKGYAPVSLANGTDDSEFDASAAPFKGARRHIWAELGSYSIHSYALIAFLALLALFGLSSLLLRQTPTIKTLFPTLSEAAVLSRTTGLDNPKVCILARTYGSQLPDLPIFLLSLWRGGLQNLQVFLVNTDESATVADLEQATTLVNQLVGQRDFATFFPWRNETSGDYGYAMTDRMLRYFYDNPSLHGCEYITITNGDNFYAQNFGSYLKPAFEKRMDLLGWDFVSHHRWFDYESTSDGVNQVDRAGRNVPKSAEFRVAFIDLGAAMFRLEFLREHNLTFENTGGYGWLSDGQFITAVKDRAKSTFMQHATLLMHQ